MNRFLALLLILMVPCFGIGEDGPRTRTFIDRVSSGSLTVTNTDDDASYELKHISYHPATSGITNTFSIAHIFRYKLPDVQTNIVSTNSLIISPITGSAEVTTNTYWYSQGYVQQTNTWTATPVTNSTDAQFLDTDDFPKGWAWEWDDVQVFTFTDTGNVDLIRVYNVYPRP